MKRDVLNDAVALVENSKERHALRHRRDAALAVRRRGRGARRKRHVLLLGTLAARSKRKRQQQRNRGLSHADSGIQGS